MILERVGSEIVREESGFSFSMRVVGSQQTVRVFISDEALEGDVSLPEEEELRAQLESDLSALEAVASEKFSLGRLAGDGVVAITLSDVVRFIE